MATRKDLLKAYKFTSARLVSALVDRDPDRLDSGLRRISMGTFASVMVGVLVMAGFGVYAFVTQGGKASTWKNEESIVIVDSQAGQVFWYNNKVLYPMQNITSARLAANTAEVVSLKSGSLEGVPRGPLLGIPGAPRQLPATNHLGFYPAQVCVTAPAAATATAPAGTRFTTLAFSGAAQPAGNSVPAFIPDASNQMYLVVEGRAHLVPKPANAAADAVPALAIQLGYPIFANSQALLASLPIGSELSEQRILRDFLSQVGQPSTAPVGEARNVGDLITVEGATETYVLLPDGAAKILPLEYEALRAAGHPTTAVPSQTLTDKLSAATVTSNDLPALAIAKPIDSQINQRQLCATWSAADQAPIISADPTPPPVVTPVEDPQLADVVVSTPGQGALLTNVDAVDNSTAAILLVDGKRYGIADAAALEALGYAGSPVDKTSTQIMRLIPQGLANGQTLNTTDAGKNS